MSTGASLLAMRFDPRFETSVLWLSFHQSLSIECFFSLVGFSPAEHYRLSRHTSSSIIIGFSQKNKNKNWAHCPCSVRHELNQAAI